jgi:hypothetical protein
VTAPERWTVFARWDDGTPEGSVEEVDVDAVDAEEARRFAEIRLELEGYQPGWEIVRVLGPRRGFFVGSSLLREPDACPGCGCRPGDGLTEGCSHEFGCGYWRAVHAELGS